MGRPRNPTPTVDILIPAQTVAGKEGIVLIERKNPPPGWALPGGYVDYGESCESAVIREALEETGLHVKLIGQLGTYSDPDRDPRGHNLSVVFVAGLMADEMPMAGDDAAAVKVFGLDELPAALAFDHAVIINDYRCWRLGEPPPKLVNWMAV